MALQLTNGRGRGPAACNHRDRVVRLCAWMGSQLNLRRSVAHQMNNRVRATLNTSLASGITMTLVLAVGACHARRGGVKPEDRAALFGRTITPDSASGAIVGVVRAADTGYPLREAQVYLAQVRGYPAPTPELARTDAKGVYVLRSVRPGRYELVVRLIAHDAVRREIHVVAGRTDTVIVRLKPAEWRCGNDQCD